MIKRVLSSRLLDSFSLDLISNHIKTAGISTSKKYVLNHIFPPFLFLVLYASVDSFTSCLFCTRHLNLFGMCTIKISISCGSNLGEFSSGKNMKFCISVEKNMNKRFLAKTSPMQERFPILKDNMF